MTPRKIFLLSACAALFVIAVVQSITKNINPVKIVSLKDDITRINIVRPDETIDLTKDGDTWIVNEKYRAKESSCDDFIS